MAMSVLDFMSASRRILGHIGRIVLIGQDWDTFVIDSDDPRLTRAITTEQHDSWMADRSERARQGRLFLALPLFVASATWNGRVRAG
jgi:hypothetical protein